MFVRLIRLMLVACLCSLLVDAVWAQEEAAQPSKTVEAQSSAAHAEGHAPHPAGDQHAAGHGPGLGEKLPLWTVSFFAAILLCIAVLPLVNGHWWEHNNNKGIVVAVLAIPIAAYLAWAYGSDGVHMISHVLKEYVQFIALLLALYVISGGVYIKGSLSGTPLANTSLLGIGAVLASVIGTTGASVLLVRPLLRANKTRVNKVHIVIFFIFIVSNCGGLLTPLGDPPLFMGFLKGVPFQWTLLNLWPQWLAVNLPLLVIFHVWDQVVFTREEKERAGSQLEEVLKHEPLRVDGWTNFLFLGGVIGVVVASGMGMFNGANGKELPFVKEAIMLALSAAAYFTTAAVNRQANNFTFAPIIEVAVLFIGIFITMAPALEILNAWGKGLRVDDLGKFAIQAPWHYFWATGALSSFLDNAPTYLTFAAAACGNAGLSPDQLGEFIDKGLKENQLLVAISCGAVFMGANSYIGNGPNFMVKAIAEENGVKMPSFFGYMAYSVGILIPLFVVITVVFFR